VLAGRHASGDVSARVAGYSARAAVFHGTVCASFAAAPGSRDGAESSTLETLLMREYHVELERAGRWWMVRIPELDGLTQAHRLSVAELMAREWIAVSTRTPICDIAVRVVRIAAGFVPEPDAEILRDLLRRSVSMICQPAQQDSA
jgi:hypothetical protein